MRAIVIGAGPAGLSAAYPLCKEDQDVHLFEADSYVGGLARCFPLWDQIVDLGPHRFFSKNRRVNELWLEIAGRDYSMVQRQTRILYQGKLFRYPLESLDALRKLGPVEAVLCVGSYLNSCRKSKVKGRKPADSSSHFSPSPSPIRLARGSSESSPEAEMEKTSESFEEWVCRRFGRRLFETFFKTYSEKLWGIPCTALDADFAAQRIKKFSLSAAIKSALFPQQKEQHRTLADEFAYPHGGTGMVYQRMAEAIQARGGQVHLNTPVRKVLVECERVVGIEFVRRAPLTPALSPTGGEGDTFFQKTVGTSRCDVSVSASADGIFAPLDAVRTAQHAVPAIERMSCGHVISSMPLTNLVMLLDDVPPEVVNACKQLKFRNTVLVYLEVLNENPFPDQWVYVHSQELQFGRVTNFRNWVPQLYGDSPNAILALEYWCNTEDEMWRRDDANLIAQAKTEIVKSGLVSGPEKLGRGFVFRIPKCYPVYLRGYQEHVRLIKAYLSTIKGLQVIGRYGSFKYNNQDHSILMGLLAAENVLTETQHNLWDVNADYESYHDSGCGRDCVAKLCRPF